MMMNTQNNQNKQNDPVPEKPSFFLSLPIVFAIMGTVCTVLAGIATFASGAGDLFLEYGWYFPVGTVVCWIIGLVSYQKKMEEYNYNLSHRSEYAAKIRKEEEKKEKQEAFERARRELKSRGIPTCPKCGSTHIQVVNQHYARSFYDLITSGNMINVCQSCGYRYNPHNE